MDAFIQKYAANISQGGMFIQSRAPQPVGKSLRFEVLLQDGDRLLKGEAKVIWVREYDAAHPNRVHGMGVKFIKLDDDSKALVDRILIYKNQDEKPRPRRKPRSPTMEVQALVREAQTSDTVEPDPEEPEESSSSDDIELDNTVMARTTPPSEPADDDAAGDGESDDPESSAANDRPSAHGGALASAPNLGRGSNGVGVALDTADQALDALMTEGSLSEELVAATLHEILEGAWSDSEGDELKDLLIPVSLPPVSMDHVLSTLHGSLGAVIPVAPGPIPAAPTPTDRVEDPVAPPEERSEPDPEAAEDGPEPEPEAAGEEPEEPEQAPDHVAEAPEHVAEEGEHVAEAPEHVAEEGEPAQEQDPEPDHEPALPIAAIPTPTSLDPEQEAGPIQAIPTPTTLGDRNLEPDSEDSPPRMFDPSLLEAAAHVSRAASATGQRGFDLSEDSPEATADDEWRQTPTAPAVEAEAEPPRPEAEASAPPDEGWTSLQTATELLDHGSSHILQDMAAKMPAEFGDEEMTQVSQHPYNFAEETPGDGPFVDEAEDVMAPMTVDPSEGSIETSEQPPGPEAQHGAGLSPEAMDGPVVPDIGATAVDGSYSDLSEEIDMDDVEFVEEDQTDISVSPYLDQSFDDKDIMPGDDIFPGDPDLDDEIFAALADIDSKGAAPRAQEPAEEEPLAPDIPTLDDLTDSMQTDPELAPAPPSEQPAKISDILVTAEDDGSADLSDLEPGKQIKPRKSNIFRRLFSKKK